MKDMGIVQCMPEQAQELIIGRDRVYVRSNLQKLKGSDVVECHEIQYDKNEFIELLMQENKKLNEQLIEKGV